MFGKLLCSLGIHKLGSRGFLCECWRCRKTFHKPYWKKENRVREVGDENFVQKYVLESKECKRCKCSLGEYVEHRI